jgi:N-acetylneuraminic acid mutarotase
MFNTLKKLSLALLVVSTALFQLGCSDSVDPEKLGNWYKSGLPSFGGSARSSAVSFSIGDKGYIGTGITNETIQRVKDFWSYDASKKIWSQIAEFGGTGRNNAVSFVVGGKAYVGTGFDGNLTVDNGYKKDFWQYDPATNKWTQVADYLGGTRMYSSAFVVGNKAYVGLGWNGSGYYQDFYTYDPAADKWTEVATFVGGKRRSATTFVLNNKAYVGFGTNNSSANTKDIYEFDPTGNGGLGAWLKVDYTQEDLAARTGAFSFVIDNKAYIVGGSGNSDVWKFIPTTSSSTTPTAEWEQMNSFIPGARGFAGGFVIGNIGYLGTGGSSYTDDFWAFDPAAELNEDDDQ